MNLEVVVNHVLVPSWLLDSTRLLQIELLLLDPLGFQSKVGLRPDAPFFGSGVSVLQPRTKKERLLAIFVTAGPAAA